MTKPWRTVNKLFSWMKATIEHSIGKHDAWKSWGDTRRPTTSLLSAPWQCLRSAHFIIRFWETFIEIFSFFFFKACLFMFYILLYRMPEWLNWLRSLLKHWDWKFVKPMWEARYVTYWVICYVEGITRDVSCCYTSIIRPRKQHSLKCVIPLLPQWPHFSF